MQLIKRFLIGLTVFISAAIAILLILNAWYVWNSGTQLSRRIAALQSAGQPVQLADLAPRPIPPEQNAAVFLRRAAADLASLQKDILARYPNYPTKPLLPAEAKQLGELFAAYPNLMPLLEQAAACPGYDPEHVWSLPPSTFMASPSYTSTLSEPRVLYRVLRARTAWLVSQGQSEEALETTLIMLRLARHLQHEPLLVSYLMAAAFQGVALDGVNEVLQSGPVSPASRQKLDAELALHDNMEGYRWALRGERAFVLSSLDELPNGDLWLMRGFSNDGRQELLKLIDQHLANSSRPYADVMAEKSALGIRPKSRWPVSGVLVESLQGSLDAAREPAERVRAATRSLRVLNAVQAQPMDGDRIPTLADLGLPVEVTTDPFNSQPLKLTRLAEGWTVYSVGRDLVDDGGKLDNRADVGFGPVRKMSAQQNNP